MKKSKEKKEIQVTIPEDLRDDSYMKFFSWAKGIGVTITKGNIIYGNNKLPSFISLYFSKGNGISRLDKCPSKHDIYRYKLDMNFENFEFAIGKNNELTETRKTLEKLPSGKLKDELKIHLEAFEKKDFSKLYETKEEQEVKHEYPFNHKYPDHHIKEKIQIPDEKRIFNAKNFQFMYYSDKPGIVPLEIDGNNGEPPKAGLYLYFDKFDNDLLVYGPWADHQRSLIQYFFSPYSYDDQIKIEQIPSRLRMIERFDTNIHFNKEFTWSFPFKRAPRTQREKDTNKPNREAFTVRFGAGSSILWSSPQGALDANGSNLIVDIRINNFIVQTTNTHAIFGESPTFQLKWDMHSSLKFHDMRNYRYDFIASNGKLYYLADHIPFIQDLINDWRNYPNKQPPKMNDHYPVKYTYAFNFRDCEILINVNPNNIIDRHSDLNKNTYFCIRAPIFDFEIISPYYKFQPEIYEYQFNINVEKDQNNLARIAMRFPEKNPLSQKLKVTEWINGDKLTLNGTYLAHGKISPDILDSIHLNINANNATCYLGAQFISYFISMWFNNFSTQKYFVTTEEYKLNGHLNEKSKYIWNLRNTDSKNHLLPQNDCEYFVTLNIKNGRIFVPLNLYLEKDKYATAIVQEFTLDARYVPTYIDLFFNLSPVLLELPVSEEDNQIKFLKKTFIGLDSVVLWAHMMIGSPPDSQYYKLLMSIALGSIKGEFTNNQIALLITFLTNFAHQWKTAYPHNELLLYPPKYNTDRIHHPDTVSKFRISDIEFKIKDVNCDLICGSAGLMNIGLPNGMRYKYDKMNNGMTDSRHVLEIPEIKFGFMSPPDINITIKGDWICVGSITTGITLNIQSKPPFVEKNYKEQMKYLRDQDATTRRLNIWTEEDLDEDIITLTERETQKLFTPPQKSSLTKTEKVKSETLIVETEVTNESTEFYDIDNKTDDEYEDVLSDDEKVTPLRQEKSEKMINEIIFVTEDLIEDEDEIETIENYNLKGEKRNIIIPISNYYKFLKWYSFDYERDGFTPLKFNPDTMFSKKSRLGLYSQFPELIIKHINDSQTLRRIYQIPKEDTTIFQYLHSKKKENNVLIPISEDEIATETTHILLNFHKDVDVFFTPNILQNIQEIVKSFTSTKQNVNDLADTFEKRFYSPPPNPYEKKIIPEWNFSNTTFTCVLNSITIQTIQSVFAPDVIKSSLLGVRTTNSIKLYGSRFYLVLSVTHKKNEDTSSLHSVSVSANLKNLDCVMQCLNKKITIKEGISHQDIDFETLKERPLLMSLSLDGLKIVGKYLINGNESQGRVSISTEKGVQVNLIKELPSLLFSIFDIWRYAITSIYHTFNENIYQSGLEELWFLCLLSAIEKEKGNVPIVTEDKNESLKAMRNLMLSLTDDQSKKLYSEIVPKKNYTRAELIQSISKSFYPLITFEKLKELVNGRSENRLRTDFFVEIEQINVSLYSKSSDEIKKTTGKINGIRIRGKLEHGLYGKNSSSGMQSPRSQLDFFRKTSATLSINVQNVSFDVFPETFLFVTCILGVQALILTKSNREMVKNLRRKVISRQQSLINVGNVPIVEKEILNLVPNEKQKYFVFLTIEVKKFQARAWTDKFNNAELAVEDISVCFNKTKQTQPIIVDIQNQNQKNRKELKLIHSGSVNVSKIKFQYNYSGEKEQDFISLFDATISGLGINEFWFRFEKKNLHLSVNVKGVHINVPYSKIWKAATFQFRKFVETWTKVITKKPNAPTNLSNNQNPKPKEEELSIISEMPSIQVIVDVNSFDVEAIVLPTLQMKFNLQRVLATFSRLSSEISNFNLHIFPSYLSFKSNLQDSFPTDYDREAPNSSRNNKDFKKKILLPEVLIVGSVKQVPEKDTKEKSTKITTSISVEYMENLITSDLLNNLLHIQSTLSKEFSSVIEALNVVMENKNVSALTKKIKTELPKAQESVKTLNIYYDVKLYLEGINFTALTSTTAIALNTGAISMNVQNGNGLKYKITLSNLSTEMVDIHNMKWSNKRMYQNKYSSTDDSYKWATFRTNIRFQNFDTVEQENNTIQTNKKFLVEVSNTHFYLRPGCIDQGSIVFKDYNESIKNLRKAIQTNEDLQSEAISSLIKKGSEYYNYYSKQIVEKVTKEKTKLIASGTIRILNITLTMPIGDNSYYGFLANENPTFIPTETMQVVIESIGLQVHSTSQENIGDDSTKIALVFKVSNTAAYFEPIENKEIQLPDLKGYEKSFNRFKIEKGVLKSQILSKEKNWKIETEATISEPVVKIDSSIVIYILHLRNDWFHPKKKFYSDPLEISAKTSSVVVTESQKVVQEATSQSTFHMTGKLKIEAGKLTLCQTCKTDTLLQTIRKTIQSEENSISITTPLPSFDMDIIHLNLSINNSSNTHLQISINWVGVKLQPKAVTFFKEVYSLVRKENVEQKKKKIKQKKETNSVKPQNWMKLLEGIIKIQRVYRGFAARKKFKLMKSKDYIKSKEQPLDKIEIKKKENQDSILKASSISFICRIQPFKVELTCAPILDVITTLEFSQPFDIVITRSYMNHTIKQREKSAAYTNIFLSSPEIIGRVSFNIF